MTLGLIGDCSFSSQFFELHFFFLCLSVFSTQLQDAVAKGLLPLVHTAPAVLSYFIQGQNLFVRVSIADQISHYHVAHLDGGNWETVVKDKLIPGKTCEEVFEWIISDAGKEAFKVQPVANFLFGVFSSNSSISLFLLAGCVRDQTDPGLCQKRAIDYSWYPKDGK